MSYLRTVVTKALGDSKLTGAEGMEYGSWTPNGVRTVVITHESVIVEYHRPYNGGKVVVQRVIPGKLATDFASSRGVSDTLAALYDHKSFAALEEIILDSSLELDAGRLLAKWNSRGRLRAVSYVQWPAGGTEWFVETVKGIREGETDPSTVGARLLSEALELPVQHSERGPGFGDWFGRFQLAPQVYSSDRKDEALYKYFRAIAEAHGLYTDGGGIDSEKKLSPKEEENLLGHRANVLADKEKIDDLKVIQTELNRIKSSGGKGDRASLKFLYSGLRTVFSHNKEVPGLGYYLSNFAEADSVPPELVKLYVTHSVSTDESKPSGRRPEGTDGYFPVKKGLVESFRRVFKHRQSKNLYTPDTDKFTPTVEKLPELVNLLTGADFDYIGYSDRLKDAKALVEGAEGDELDPRIKGLRDDLARAKRDFSSEDAQEAVNTIEKELDKELARKGGADSSDIDFYKKAKQGKVTPGTVYKATLSDHAGGIAAGSWKLAQLGIKAGVAAAAKGSGWGVVLEPVVGAILKASDDTVNYGLYSLIEKIDKQAEGERVKSESMDTDREGVLTAIFDQRIYWGIGIDLVYRFVKDAEAFSKLKGRQVRRYVRSQTGVYGLGEFLEKHRDEVGPHAIPFFKKYDYILLTEGKFSDDRIDVDFTRNRALDPVSFYQIILEELVKLSRDKGNAGRAWADGATGPGKLGALDALAREGLGLPSRSYQDIHMPAKPTASMERSMRMLREGDMGTGDKIDTRDPRVMTVAGGMKDAAMSKEDYTGAFKGLGYNERYYLAKGYPPGYTPSKKVLRRDSSLTNARATKKTAVGLSVGAVAGAGVGVATGTVALGVAAPVVIGVGVASAAVYGVGALGERRHKRRLNKELRKDMLIQGFSGDADTLDANKKALRENMAGRVTGTIDAGFVPARRVANGVRPSGRPGGARPTGGRALPATPIDPS